MEEKVKISVIMGVYNPVEQKQLQAAVRSMIRQTMTDWELILCDDGSHITYQPLIDEAIEMDERIIRIRNKTNKGLGYSLNQCLSIAKGKYIARMDGDDISEPERFRKQYDFLERHPEYQWVGSIPDCLMNMVCGERIVCRNAGSIGFPVLFPVYPSVGDVPGGGAAEDQGLSDLGGDKTV